MIMIINHIHAIVCVESDLRENLTTTENIDTLLPYSNIKYDLRLTKFLAKMLILCYR